jgi:hypothetical protein
MKDDGLCGQRFLCGVVCHPSRCDRLRREREVAVRALNASSDSVALTLDAILQTQLIHGQLLIKLTQALGFTIVTTPPGDQPPLN